MRFCARTARGALVLALVLAGLAAGQGSAPEPSEHAFVSVIAPRDQFFEHETIRLRLRVGFEKQFQKENLLPLFQQALDVPAKVEWSSAVDGAKAIDVAVESESGTQTFVLNERVERGASIDVLTSSGRCLSFVELERALVDPRAGEIAIPAPRMHFAFATSFEEDLVRGRVPLDRREASVEGQALTLRVEPLPSAGRPVEFSNAIGRFAVSAEAEPRQLDIDTSLRVTMRIEGEGNFETLDAPRLDRLEGFRLRGTTAERTNGRCTFVYDLAPTSTRVREVPALSLSFFDPTPPAGYSTIWTKPISIFVRNPPTRLDAPALPGAGIKAAGSVMVVAFVIALASVATLVFVGVVIYRRVLSRRRTG